MDKLTIGHIALFVPDLRAAESFYQNVFAMQLLMREAELDDGLWYTLAPDKGWSEAQAAGIEIDMIALQRDTFVLALFQGNPAPLATLLEIGVSLPAAAITAVRGRLPESVQFVPHERGDLMFRDPFDYLWHLVHNGEAFRSNGEASGRWLEL